MLYDLKNRNKRTILQHTKAIYNRHIANSIYTKGDTECISLESRNKTRYHLSPLLLDIVLKSNNKKKRNKRIDTGKEEVKISLFADNIILYTRKP